MRVARLYAWGDVRLEEERVPAPGPGEITMRVDACGVCGSDALVWYVEQKAPAVLGHEAVGTVAAVGAGVTALRPGDRVFAHHHAPCMQCEECRRGLWSNCATWRRTRLEPGGFAQYARVPAAVVAHDTLPLPLAMSFDTATFIEPAACCIRAIRRQGGIEVGDCVLIIGLGAMGLLLVQLARIYGAAGIIGSDFREDRRERARRMGADACLDPQQQDTSDTVRAASNGRGADVVIVCPADAAAIATGLAAAAPGGRVVCFTPLPPDLPLSVPQSAVYFREVALLQSYSCGPDETRESLRLLAEGALDVQALITHHADLAGVAAALERARGKADGLKTIIYPNSLETG
jgi:L-iditol 2-dehydrogenase